MAHPDLDRLLDHCIVFAQKMLKKEGSFHPFAATIDGGGEPTAVAIYDGPEASPEASALVERYTNLLTELAGQGEIQAAALCYDGRVSVGGGEKKDAVTVALQHKDAECLTVYLPYSKKFLRGYEYGTIFASEGERRFFV